MECKYFVGQVANLLSGCQSTSTAAPDSNKQLTKLFSVDCSEAALKKKAKKEKKDSTVKAANQKPSQTGEKSKAGFCPPKGIVHESLLKKTPSDSIPYKSKKRKTENDSESEEDTSHLSVKKKIKRKRDPAADSRTVFVGNVAITVTKKDLKKMFSKYGGIENIRFRCPPTSDPKKPKKLVVIKHDFHPDRHNMIAFVCFKEESSAKDALAVNGHLLEGLHLRVDLASKSTEHDSNKSVFVGNLPFSLEEEDLRSHFRRCGKIENVRVVRDNKTGIGKGFGYVQFKEQSTVSIALMLKSSELAGREIRVMRCASSADATKSSKKNPAKRRIFERSIHEKLRPKKKKKKNSESIPPQFKKNKVLKEQFKGKKKNNKKGLSTTSKFTHKRDSRKQMGKSNKKFKRNK
ncbi:RNA-binding protein 34-like [Gigantopelta aegis]|uniref:RNA-binding protein 34-like n=1 Tax=Gigantopelta aegis TaxID=1735272 RepID=UPI001B88DF57|nr:RNA-binding protein 34-like [Gigantopelta aegis]XP_041352997.1 RNA-binding protein 34-like [Gigantopelta aegis]